MNKLAKWKKAVYLTSAIGIIGLSTYGIQKTVSAYSELNQHQTVEYSLTSDLPSDKAGLGPGTVCSPYGCAGCSGCVSVQYQQSVEVLPDSATRIEQVY